LYKLDLAVPFFIPKFKGVIILTKKTSWKKKGRITEKIKTSSKRGKPKSKTGKHFNGLNQ